MNNKQAFTLIELLVVVLIIGILAAVALPQYQKAVWKGRLATIKDVTKSIANGEDAYYLATGSYTADLDALSLDFPTPNSSSTSTNETSYHYSWGRCHVVVSSQYAECFLYKDNDPFLSYQANFSLRGGDICFAHNQNALANKICQNETHRTTSSYSSTSWEGYYYP